MAPHFFSVAKKDSVCPLPLSFATTNGIQFVSLPAPTKMFQFSAFPILADLSTNGKRSRIRQSRDQWLRAPTSGLLQLATTFVGLSNQAIPQMALFSLRCFLVIKLLHLITNFHYSFMNILPSLTSCSLVNCIQ